MPQECRRDTLHSLLCKPCIQSSPQNSLAANSLATPQPTKQTCMCLASSSTPPTSSSATCKSTPSSTMDSSFTLHCHIHLAESTHLPLSTEKVENSQTDIPTVNRALCALFASHFFLEKLVSSMHNCSALASATLRLNHAGFYYPPSFTCGSITMKWHTHVNWIDLRP